MNRNWYKIPVLNVQDVLFNIEGNPAVIAMKAWCENNCEDGWNMGTELERRWFPVFYFEREWDAFNFMRYLVEMDLLYNREEVEEVDPWTERTFGYA